MTDASPAFEKLKVDFMSRLPRRLERIDALWKKLIYLRWDGARLDVLINEVHKLSGTAGTYGLVGLGLRARALEAVLESVRGTPGAPTTEQRDLISRFVAELRHWEETLGPEDDPVASLIQVRGKAPHVALIEDDEQLAQILCLWLEDMGIRPHLYANPEAFDADDSVYRFQAILLDLAFPDAQDGGLKWLETRGRRWTARSPVIVMTSRTDIVSRIRALRLGATGYLIKPVSRDALEMRLGAALKLGHRARDRVLVIDDDQDILRYYKRLLEESGFEVHCLAQPLETLEVLEACQPDVILMDYHMPGCTGLELAQLLKQDERYFQIPILFVSGSPEALDQRELLSIVGNDFLCKPVEDVVLIMHLRRLVAQARRRLQTIGSVSRRPQPRGLMNRALFYQELEQHVAQVRSGKLPKDVVALVLIQVRDAGVLREQLGLRGTAELGMKLERLVAEWRDVNGMGTAAGDTACLCLFSVSDPAVLKRTLNDALEKLEGQLSESTGAQISLVAGAVLLGGQHLNAESAVEDVESAVDEALSEDDARAMVRRAEGTASVETEAGEDDMQQALLAQRYRLEFQPVVAVDAGEVLHEALVRLESRQGELYTPGQFLERARQLGLQDVLDRWVIEHAIRQVWARAEDDVDIHLIVKLMPQERHIRQMVDYLVEAREAKTWQKPVRLYVSLPEPWVATHMDRMQALLESLNTSNIGCVMEQAGSTSQTERIVDRLPVDFIKLSHEMTQKAVSDPKEQARVRRLLEKMAGRGGVIASGVEDARAFSALWGLGVRLFQGYFIEAPGEGLDRDTSVHVDMDSSM